MISLSSLVHFLSLALYLLYNPFHLSTSITVYGFIFFPTEPELHGSSLGFPSWQLLKFLTSFSFYSSSGIFKAYCSQLFLYMKTREICKKKCTRFNYFCVSDTFFFLRTAIICFSLRKLFILILHRENKHCLLYNDFLSLRFFVINLTYLLALMFLILSISSSY